MTPPALLIVDVQQGLDDPRYGARSTPEAEGNMARLLQTWRGRGWPVVHVQHHSTRPDSPLRPDAAGCAIKPEVAPEAGERVFVKHGNSAFVGTGLEAHLRERRIGTLVVVGLTTDHCVSSTARSASDLGFAVRVIADATAAHERVDAEGERVSAQEIHRAHLASLHKEVCTVLRTADVLREGSG